MTIWLCAWISMTLSHDLSHALHADNHHAPCAVCQLLHQGAPAVINTELAVRAVSVFECVCENERQLIFYQPPILLAATSPRGPPALLVV